MQLHPHFLFNTLHAVGVLTEENPAGPTDLSCFKNVPNTS